MILRKFSILAFIFGIVGVACGNPQSPPQGTTPPQLNRKTNPNILIDPRPVSAVKILLSVGGWCGGLLAADDLIITAGHCFDAAFKAPPVVPIRILFSNGETRAYRGVTRYMPGGFISVHEDIAWVTFDGGAPSSYQIIPISSNPNTSLASSSEVLFQGYTTGPIKLHPAPTQLVQYQNDLFTNFGINLTLAEVQSKYTITRGKHLAGGDSGGPVYFLRDGQWECLGVLSGSYDPLNPGDDREIFTAIAAYEKWIQTSSGKALQMSP